MDDLISRQAAIELMLAALDDDWEPDYAKDRMCELPSAQRTGRWIYNDYGNGCGNWHCSVCNKIPIVYDKNANYCPNCGAQMEVE